MIEEFAAHFKEKDFVKPTAIQEAVAQPLAEGKSLVGIAPTGSGKTLAYTWPLLPRLTVGGGTQMLVFEPSQELALQVSRVMREWAQLIGLHVQSLTGGANVHRQTERLKKQHPEVVVGTPGRILHLLDNRQLKLKQLRVLVFDEADDLLADDTEAVVEDIERRTPLNTQLAFFSATSSARLKQVPLIFGRDVVTVDVRATDDSRGPVQHGLYYARTMSQKAQALARLAKTKNFRALVFFSSIKTLHYTASRLKHAGVSAAALGGRQRQVERAKVMRDFRQRKLRLLLTTDVAARGIDIPKLPAVVNFELPDSVNEYVHRTGRTGRQGEPGLVINLGDDHDFRDLKKMLADTDYHLEKLAIDDRRVVDQGKADEKPTSVRKRNNRAIRQGQRDRHDAARKSAKRTLDQFSQPKKHRKKKQRKNKGIRFKHRQAEAQGKYQR